MTNEELKKKIKEVLRKRMTELLGSCQTDEISLDEEGKEAVLFYADEFADALIAAGIVDKSDYASMKETAVRYKAEVSKAGARVKEAEHRAEVAERALRRKCESEADSTCPYDEKSEKCKECSEKRLCSTEYATQCFYEKALQQAEKELAEEGEDDECP